jgi:hypothetical protein
MFYFTNRRRGIIPTTMAYRILWPTVPMWCGMEGLPYIYLTNAIRGIVCSPIYQSTSNERNILRKCGFGGGNVRPTPDSLV